MAKGGGLSNAVIGGIVSAIALPVGAWFFGFLPVIWAAITAAAATVWAIVSYPVIVPLAVLAALALPIVLWLFRRIRSIPVVHATIEEPDQPLGELELSVLRLLARADGAINFDSVLEHLKCSRLLLIRAVQELTERNLVELNHHIARGGSICLSPKGLEFALAQGFQLGGLRSW